MKSSSSCERLRVLFALLTFSTTTITNNTNITMVDGAKNQDNKANAYTDPAHPNNGAGSSSAPPPPCKPAGLRLATPN